MLSPSIMVIMNRLENEKRIRIIKCLVEGNSVRATIRMTGVAKNTVAKLLVDLGAACSQFQDENLRNLPCCRLQCDEIWSFVGAKQKDVSDAQAASGRGDIWTWTAIDAGTKLVPCWMVGPRDVHLATSFIGDLASRLRFRVQLTTDGHRLYLNAVEDAFGSDIDYAQLIKVYGTSAEAQTRPSLGQCIEIEYRAIGGPPAPEYISSVFVERQNLIMRRPTRRIPRLTNSFSKKLENHMAAIALHFMYYNFCRVHQTLPFTPAVEAGISNHVWTVEEVVALL